MDDLPKTSSEAWRMIHRCHAAAVECALSDAEPFDAHHHAEAMEQIERRIDFPTSTQEDPTP